MITVRDAKDRGHFNFGWLDTNHTFSFGDYYDPRFMGFRSLRVINEDRVHPGRGFPTHPHRDMEIITYVLEGSLEHKDSMGTGSVIRPGEVQRMSAGSGITHSESNSSREESVHLLQIWIMPDTYGIRPSYEQKMYAAEEKQGRLRLIASPDGRDDSVKIHQDTSLYAALLEKGQEVVHGLNAKRHAWVQVARGAVSLNGQLLSQGDGAAVSDEQALAIVGQESAEVLLFDLA
ncbi:MAG TPA: pirin family protein [Pyrinomonadaceae bacterium]|jgi:redox-sensitive bicupin YhaK (pirin superfamily)|nr:pirin family protein [Pyrinomonadaceae bacterium]